MAEGQDPGALERECKLLRRACVKLPVEQHASQQIPQETIRVTVVIEDIVRQLGAHPKSPSREWVQEQAQMRPAQAAAPHPPPQPVPHANAPTPFKTMFDGTASKLAFFLNRAWSYIERHGNEFHNEAELVQFLGDNLMRRHLNGSLRSMMKAPLN
ncbi:Gem-associated protein 5, partial [Ophiophagus hannah]